MTEVEQQPPPQNGIDLSAAEDDDSSKARPADIEQDMREMERRKRVEAIMGSKLFREELERIVDSARDGGGILQHLSDIMGVPTSTRVGNVFKATNCMLPINDIRGVESMGYAKGEKILRCKLAATFRLLDLYGWTQGLGAQITARLKVDQEYFLVNPYGMMYHEITASSLNKVDMQGQIVEQGTTNFGVNKNHFALHSVVHAARPDIRCAIYIGCTPVVAVSSLKVGLLPITRDACVLGEITTHTYTGTQMDADERDRLVRALGPNSKVLILSNYGALCCGETIEEAFFAASHIVKACETQLQLLPVGVDNLVFIPEESRKAIYVEARRPPEDLEKKFAAAVATVEAANAEAAASAGAGADGGASGVSKAATVGTAPKWRVGGAEFEALMRMLDNAGYRTGYIYRHPLIKSDPPKPKNDVELPPAVSSLGYLLEEEELLRQGIWKKGDFRKGGDRSRWLNSPNVYQKVEVLETGTPDPKKITKWVAEGSPTHSTPVRIEDPLQFVPAGTNPKEFKRLQQQIKDNRRADKISAGPQSHILEGVTWDEANRIKDATVSSAGDHVVLMGAASKGIIQRGYQHNAAVYKAPYAKNPFDNVTDDELNEYKRTVERKKKSIHGEYTDTDFSESEPLSSMPISAPQQTKQTTITTAAVSQSEPEDVSEHQVMRIQTQQAPIPSQPEVVLSDATLNFINGERSHTAVNRKPPTGRDIEYPEEEEENYANIPKYETIVENTNLRQYSGSTNNNNNNSANNNNNNQFRKQQIQDEIINVDNDFEMVKQQQQQQQQYTNQSNKENIYCGHQNIKRNTELIAELKNDALFQRQKHKLQPPTKYEIKECTIRQGQNYNNNNMRTTMHLGGSDNNNISEKSVGGEGVVGGGGCVELIVSGSPYNECCLGGVNDIQQQQQQRGNLESLGFRPIHPIDPRPDANATVTQQPQFCYADPNNNNNNPNNDDGGCRCRNQHNHHHHHHHHPQHQHAHPHPHPHPHHSQCQHAAGPAVGIVTLPNFEQAFGHLLGRPTTELCAIYYDNYAPLYETTQYADTTRTASVVSTNADIDEADNPYKKSLACCTPAVCDSIFESLRKPNASNDNNLIFNIPFTAETPDTTTTTTSTSITTPRKTRFDQPQKTNSSSGKSVGAQAPNAHSPYRTLSHFGFNSPQRDPQPDHKHIPCTAEPKKYVPLRKSISYEEIFSSPRYVDLCEYCFEKIVRLKPEIAQQTQTQTRLRNLCDYNGATGGFGTAGAGAGAGAGGRYQAGFCSGIMYQPSCGDSNAYDYVEYASSDTTEETLPPFSSQLEPVLEVVEEVEPDSNEDATKKVLPLTTESQLVARTPSNSSFIEKIMRLNYSEESTDWNFAQAPHKVVSCTNLTLELERAIREESQCEQQETRIRSDQAVETRHYNTEMESELDAPNVVEEEGAVTEYVNVEAASESARRLSVTEIWEFMQWQDEDDEGQDSAKSQHEYPNSQHSSSQGSGAICLYYENARESASNNNRTIENVNNALSGTQDDRNSVERNTSGTAASPANSAATSNDSAKQERRRSLMTREERSRRKLVFQELWEDHISFLDGKELNSLSDTESAIDGQQEESSVSARREFEDNAAAAATAGVASDSGGASVVKEQDVTHELNEGNELLVVHTKEGNVSSTLVVSMVGCQGTTTTQQPLEAEVFNSRSVILKNCPSGTTQQVDKDDDDDDDNNDLDIDTVTKSETLMKLQTTAVRRFSLHDLANSRSHPAARASLGRKDVVGNLHESWTNHEATAVQNNTEAVEDKVRFVDDELQQRMQEKEVNSSATDFEENTEAQGSPIKNESEKLTNPKLPTTKVVNFVSTVSIDGFGESKTSEVPATKYNIDTEIEATPSKDSSKKLTTSMSTHKKFVNFVPTPSKGGFEEAKTTEVCAFKTQPSHTKDETEEPNGKEALAAKSELETTKPSHYQKGLTVSELRKKSHTPSAGHETKQDGKSTPTRTLPANQPKAKLNKPKALNLRGKRSMHNPCARIESDRPPTPKPPPTTSKLRKLSTHEPQPTLHETETKSRQAPSVSFDGAAVCSSESDDNQSARTYDLSASREFMFFREHEMDTATTNATTSGVDSEGNQDTCMTDERNVRRHADDIETEQDRPDDDNAREKTNKVEENFQHMAELEVAEILINKLKAPAIERAKAGMALPTSDKQKTKSDHNTGTGNVTNVARVAQLTAEALREPSSKVYTTPRLTKRSRKHATIGALNEQGSNEASTSIQAAQKQQTTTTKDLKLIYEPNVEEYVLFKQNLPTPTSPTHAIVADDRVREVVEDYAFMYDREEDEIHFAELLESDEHEDLTKLSEDFEELLMNVENLQLQPQTRERGGAETHDATVEGDKSNDLLEDNDDDDDDDDESDSHLNAMERKILRKIRENQLSECEEIFDKIEMTIRNKMTPSQLEQLVKEQSLVDASKTSHIADGTRSSHSTFTASTPERFLSAHTTLADESASVGQSFARENVSGISEDPNSSSFGSGCGGAGEVDADESSTLTPHSSCNYSRQSTEFITTAAEGESTAALKLRRSRSLTPIHQGRRRELSPPPAKLNKTTTPTQDVRKSLNGARRDSKGSDTSSYKTKVGARTISKWPRVSTSTPEMKTTKRNFILENIRNAAIPRHIGGGGGGGVVSPGSGGGGGLGCGVKRMQSNAQAIFCKNPFESLSASSNLSKMSNSSLASSTTSSSRTIVVKSSSTNSTQTTKQISPRNSSTGVYTFQSKLVRGSPRFWVSLTQPNVKKLQTQKRRRRSQQQHYQHRSMRLEANDSTGSLREYDEAFVDKENAEQMEHEKAEVHERLVAQEEEEMHEEPDAHEEAEGNDEPVTHGELADEEDNEELAKEKKHDANSVENVEPFNLQGAAGTQDIRDDITAAEHLSGGGGGGSRVEHELVALGEQIQQLEPHLDKFHSKMRDFGEHVAQCTRHMDDCIAVQDDIVENQRQLREQMALHQYAEHIMCQVQTYSISETED